MMLSPNYGIVNQVLQALHLPVFNWFSDIRTAFGMLVLIDVWQSAPFVFLLLYAALQSVPQGQYEAARIDGANSLKILFYVTIPNIKNSLALCALLRTIDSFRLFDKVNLLTGGGPANSTSTITQYLYNYGIKSLDFGFGSAGAIVMTILVLILSSVYIKRADLLTAYETGYYRITAHLHQRGLRGKRYSSTPRTRPGRTDASMRSSTAAAQRTASSPTARAAASAQRSISPLLPRLDLAVSTHIHEDHLCGLLRVCRDHPPLLCCGRPCRPALPLASSARRRLRAQSVRAQFSRGAR